MEAKTTKSFGDFCFLVFTNLKVMCSVILFIIMILISTIFSWWIVLRIANKEKLTIEQTESGGIIYQIGREQNLVFNLSASTPWASTDFNVKKGEDLHIRASGSVNLAIHHLIDAAQKDYRPVHSWVGPDGMSDLNKLLLKKQDIWRLKCLIMPDKPYGSLIAGISNNKMPPDKDAIWYIGSKWDGKVPIDGTLWFIVNDNLLEINLQDSYDVPADHKESNYNIPRMWDDIVKDQYWNVWYDDNIGSFLINVKKD